MTDHQSDQLAAARQKKARREVVKAIKQLDAGLTKLFRREMARLMPNLLFEAQKGNGFRIHIEVVTPAGTRLDHTERQLALETLNDILLRDSYGDPNIVPAFNTVARALGFPEMADPPAVPAQETAERKLILLQGDL